MLEIGRGERLPGRIGLLANLSGGRIGLLRIGLLRIGLLRIILIRIRLLRVGLRVGLPLIRCLRQQNGRQEQR